MLAVGEIAPEFTGLDANGTPFSLSQLKGRPSVVYFFPKANSPGCTVEARGFTEHYADFVKAGVAVVGVSVDSVESQRNFRAKCAIPYPLIADADKSISRAFGVVGLLGVAKRVTFFLDREGRVAEVVEGILPGPHVRHAVDRLARSGTG